MTTCPHTGITVPECSCRACVQRLIEHHMPASLAADAGLPAASAEAMSAMQHVDLTAIADSPGPLGMLRRLRRPRLRRTA